MKLNVFLLSGLFAVFMFGCESPVAKDQALQPRTGVWIDVRTAKEYESGHLSGAVHIPYDMIGNQIAAVVPDKAAEIHLYCRTGRRSGMALKTLENMGYTNVVNEGSYAKLKKR